jgi:hypothetical protein
MARDTCITSTGLSNPTSQPGAFNTMIPLASQYEQRPYCDLSVRPPVGRRYLVRDPALDGPRGARADVSEGLRHVAEAVQHSTGGVVGPHQHWVGLNTTPRSNHLQSVSMELLCLQSNAAAEQWAGIVQLSEWTETH